MTKDTQKIQFIAIIAGIVTETIQFMAPFLLPANNVFVLFQYKALNCLYTWCTSVNWPWKKVWGWKYWHYDIFQLCGIRPKQVFKA